MHIIVNAINQYYRIGIGILVVSCAVCSTAEETLDLSYAKILAPEPAVSKAAEMLQDEIALRTGLTLEFINVSEEGQDVPVVFLATVETCVQHSWTLPEDMVVPDKPEGYALYVDSDGSPVVYLIGRDARGVLFAVGDFIRKANIDTGGISIDNGLIISTAPRFSMRGHQMGYRSTPNSYDAWDVATYEQYFRDLAIFGANCFEFTMTVHPGLRAHGHMKMSTWEMNQHLSLLLDDYDLDVWIWQPIPDEEALSDPEQLRDHLRRRRKSLEKLPRLDALFVPGGDEGKTLVEVLMPFMEQMAPVLKEIHQTAALWVSNQTFEHPENEYFFNYLEKKQPEWLEGVVYGPWTKMSLSEERKRTPERYKLRRYADITHNTRSQYVVPDWDRAFAHINNRECINPRPRAMAQIYKRYMNDCGDFLAYSEGIHDDLNKVVWSRLAWDPDQSIEAIVLEYAKVFFSEEEAQAIADGLFMLEENWQGPILTNTTIDATLKHWQAIEERNWELLSRNWRLQMYILRAYYDAYVQRKAQLAHEYERQAMDALREAATLGAIGAMEKARAALIQVDTHPTAPELRVRIEELSKLLFDTIGFQLSVNAPYHASNPERGALLDTLDFPLNDRVWLETQFNEIEAMPSEADQLARISVLVNWEDPGPGGYYDDLGNPWKQPHLVHSLSWEEDPGYIDSPQCAYDFAIDKRNLQPSSYKLSWLDQACTLFNRPLQMHYENLDPKATYKLRVTYAGRFQPTLRLVANGNTEIYGWLPQPEPIWPLEFAIPQSATQSGVLDLEWQLIPEKDKSLWRQSIHRGIQVAEVWLVKE